MRAGYTAATHAANLIEVLPTLHKAHAELKLYVRESPPSAGQGALYDGVLDLIITMLPVHGAVFESTFLFRRLLLLAVRADHPFTRLNVVGRASLGGEDSWRSAAGHQFHDAVHSRCVELGARLRYDFEGTSLDSRREIS